MVLGNLEVLDQRLLSQVSNSGVICVAHVQYGTSDATVFTFDASHLSDIVKSNDSRKPESTRLLRLLSLALTAASPALLMCNIL